MNKEEREREKEIKRLMYLKSQLIKETKKELSQLRDELNSLGNNKERREGYGETKKLVRKKQR